MSAQKNKVLLLIIISLLFSITLFTYLVVSNFNYYLTLFSNSKSNDVEVNNINLERDLIKVVTHFEAEPFEDENHSSPWPQVVIIANNGTGYDGPYDYSSCPVSGAFSTYRQGCGIPSLFKDKWVSNVLTVTDNLNVHTVTIPAKNLFIDPYPSDNGSSKYVMTKLSYVFLNDYYVEGVGDRNLSIKKVLFYDEYDNLFATYEPSMNSYWAGYGGRNDETRYSGISFYFDLGEVTVTDNTEVANGFLNAFDKRDMQSIVANSTRENNKWFLGREGSFNIVTSDLYQQYINRNNTSDKKVFIQGVRVLGPSELTELTVRIPNENNPFYSKNLYNNDIKLNGTYRTPENLELDKEYVVATTVPSGFDAYFSICNNCTNHANNSYKLATKIPNSNESFVKVKTPKDFSKDNPTFAYVDLYLKLLPSKDLNKDGNITVADVMFFIKWLSSNDQYNVAYDINLDGNVSLLDALDILNLLIDS